MAGTDLPADGTDNNAFVTVGQMGTGQLDILLGGKLTIDGKTGANSGLSIGGNASAGGGTGIVKSLPELMSARCCPGRPRTVRSPVRSVPSSAPRRLCSAGSATSDAG